MRLKLLLLATTFITTASAVLPAAAASDSPMILAQAQEQRQNATQDERRQQRQEQKQERAQQKQDQQAPAQRSAQDQKAQRQDERRAQQQEKAQQKQEQKQERAQQRDERPAAQNQQNQKNEQPRQNAQERREQKQEDRQNAREQKQEDRRDQKQDARDQRQDERRDQKQDARDQKQDNRRDARDERRDDRRDEAVLRGRGERLDDLRKERREEKDGNRVVIREPGGRTIVRETGGRAFIRHDETERFRVLGGNNARFEQRGNERITIINRPGGIQIYTSVDNDGRLLRRWRRGPDGREVIIIDNRPRRPGASLVVQLAPPVIRIPRERYIVTMRNAQPPAVYAALTAPPVEPVERAYTLDEVRSSPQVLARMPRVDLDTLTFATGSWEVDPSQAERLSVIADGLKRAIDANPNEVFLIEGHTDAVGDEVDNLSLSDRRAESVAILLSEQFAIPPENLTTQGYGENDLKVQTDAAEEANRRVTVRRITPLLSGQAEASGQGTKQ